MRVAIIDYGSGNLRSATKAFERAAREAGIDAEIDLTDDAGRVATADRIVLPGVGAYADCRRGLDAVSGMTEAVIDVVEHKARPFPRHLRRHAAHVPSRGLEKDDYAGFGWIKGDVKEMTPDDPALKIPQIGWNTLDLRHPHALFDGIYDRAGRAACLFRAFYHLAADHADDVIATTGYGGPMTAFVGRDNVAGSQFHPEKSQKLGLASDRQFLALEAQ